MGGRSDGGAVGWGVVRGGRPTRGGGATKAPRPGSAGAGALDAVRGLNTRGAVGVRGDARRPAGGGSGSDGDTRGYPSTPARAGGVSVGGMRTEQGRTGGEHRAALGPCAARAAAGGAAWGRVRAPAAVHRRGASRGPRAAARWRRARACEAGSSGAGLVARCA